MITPVVPKNTFDLTKLEEVLKSVVITLDNIHHERSWTNWEKRVREDVGEQLDLIEELKREDG
jgi:hypothetical protein